MPVAGVAGTGGEWQGRVWPLPSPAGASKGQCLGMPRLFLEQRGFQKRLPLAISGWALTHPWLDARGLPSTCCSCPPPHHCGPGKALLLFPSLSAPWTPWCSRESKTAP